MFIFFSLIWLLVIGGLAATVAWAIKLIRQPPASPSESALAILDQRFARGEIDEKEYRERRNVLVGTGRTV
jgi:putative membrane protein